MEEKVKERVGIWTEGRGLGKGVGRDGKGAGRYRKING